MAKYDILTTLLLNANPYNQGIDGAKRKSQEFEQSAKKVSGGIKSAFMGAFAVIGGGITVIEGVKRTIGATQGTADAFEVTMAGMTTATDAFFKALSSGDWSNFLKNIKDAKEAGSEYARIMDEIGDRQRSVDLFTAEQKQKLSGFEEVFRNTSLPAATRQQALDDYKKLQTEILGIQKNINQEILNAEENIYSTLSRLDKERIDYIISNYDREIQKIREAHDNIARYKELQKAAEPVTTVNSWGVASTFVDENAQKKLREFTKSLNAEQLKWFNMMQAYNKLNDDELEKIKTAKLNLINIDNQIAALNVILIRQQNSISNQTKVEAKEAKKISDEKQRQLDLELDLEQKKKDIGGLQPLTPIGARTLQNNLPTSIVLPDSSDSTDEQINNNNELIDSNRQLENSINSVGQSFLQMFEDGKIEGGEFESFMSQIFMQIASTMVEAAAQTIATKATETAAVVAMEGAQAEAAIASKSIQKSGWLGLIAAAAGIATVALMFAGIKSDAKKYANSGIVPGSLTSGDLVPAMVNSGEMILNKGDQSSLWNIIQSGGGFGGLQGNVSFEIEDRKLVGVLENYSKSNQIARGRNTR